MLSAYDVLRYTQQAGVVQNSSSRSGGSNNGLVNLSAASGRQSGTSINTQIVSATALNMYASNNTTDSLGQTRVVYTCSEVLLLYCMSVLV
jgi:hypothetical protein